MNQNKEWKENVIRESVSVEKPVLAATTQAVAEGELSAPSALPPIAKVLMVDGGSAPPPRGEQTGWTFRAP